MTILGKQVRPEYYTISRGYNLIGESPRAYNGPEGGILNRREMDGHDPRIRLRHKPTSSSLRAFAQFKLLLTH